MHESYNMQSVYIWRLWPEQKSESAQEIIPSQSLVLNHTSTVM
jgi:hypothetical protein